MKPVPQHVPKMAQILALAMASLILPGSWAVAGAAAVAATCIPEGMGSSLIAT